MPVPSSRTPVRIARGTYANLSTTAALEALALGEVCFASDQGRLYMRTLAGLTAISSTNETAPTPAEVTASPAFTGGTGTQADPYLITNVGNPFSGTTSTSAQEITISGTAGDIAVFTDNSPAGSADRFKGQDVGILNAAGEFKLNLKYADEPGTTTDNTTYTGNLQIGTAHITWVVVQSNLTQLSEDTATEIGAATGVGDVVTSTTGTATGGTAPYTSEIKWQRSFTGIDGFFDTGSTGATYTITSADAGYYVRAVTTVTDSTDAAQGGPLTIELASAASNQLNTNQVTTVNSLTLSEDNTAGARFTSQSYSLDAILNPDGTPTSTKGAKIKFEGTFGQYPSTSNITTITDYMDNINRNINDSSGNNFGAHYQNSNHGYSGTAYGDYSTPVLMRNPDNDEVKFFMHSCSHNSSYQLYTFRSSYALGAGTPFTPQSNELETSSRWIPDMSNQSGSGRKHMYEDINGSTGSHQYYSPQPVRAIDDTYYCMIGSRQYRLLYSDNVFASTVLWKTPGWFVQDPVSGYGPGNSWQSNYLYAWTENGSHMVYPMRINGSNEFLMRIITPDKSAGENIMTTETYSEINFASEFFSSDYQSSSQLRGMWSQGSRVFVAYIYYTTNNYYKFFIRYCDFSVNDGTNPSHWILAHTELDNSAMIRQSGSAVQENGTKMWIVGDGGEVFSSNNGGDSWSYAFRPFMNLKLDVYSPSNVQYYNAAYIGDLLYFATARYTLGSYNSQYGLGQNTWTSTFWSSNDNGGNWNYEGHYTHASHSSSYPAINHSYGGAGRSIREEGGFVIINGKSDQNHQLKGFAIPHYQTVTFADTTNLSNDSFREHNKVRQGSVTFNITESSQTTKVYNIKGGDIVTGEPVTNTVSYFGGSQATLYAVLSGAGAVTDLTSSDPGFVNFGYGVDNTITFPATFPSGATPDVELPSGTTIQATVEFTNSQGTVTADSNTLTP